MRGSGFSAEELDITAMDWGVGGGGGLTGTLEHCLEGKQLLIQLHTKQAAVERFNRAIHSMPPNRGEVFFRQQQSQSIHLAD